MRDLSHLDVRELVEAIYHRLDGLDDRLAKLSQQILGSYPGPNQGPDVVDVDDAIVEPMTASSFYPEADPVTGPKDVTPASFTQPSASPPCLQPSPISSEHGMNASTAQLTVLPSLHKSARTACVTSLEPIVPSTPSPPLDTLHSNNPINSRWKAQASNRSLPPPLQPPHYSRMQPSAPTPAKRPPDSASSQLCLAPPLRARETAAASHRSPGPFPPLQKPPPPAVEPLPHGLFMWKDSVPHRAPESWRFPSTSCAAMWTLWFQGDPVHRIGPFRHLTTSDVSDVTSKIQLYYAQVVMGDLLSVALVHALAMSPDGIAKMSVASALSVLEMAMSLRGLERMSPPTRPTTSVPSLASEQLYIHVYQRIANSRIVPQKPRHDIRFL
ncbi:hypothetical protein DYB25_011712 [Aphanomyces astaci]|uniref:Uncharacterized protein n=1 Tax=Aphanomyces astaci TaxID=112090 RepID=A0A397AA23_APHAT|nr:hypothetical protein DYB25_011712 [Aphanomyces astaci]